MSLGGSKGSQSTTDARLNGMSVDQCAYGNAIPLGYGQNRWPMFLLWYGNFVATPHTTSSGGGKGGGGGGGNTTYTYSASMAMGLGEGPATNIGQVWQDKTLTTLATLGYTFFSGASPQAVWSYLTNNFAAQAVPYDHTAYLATANTQLGSSAALPNLTFEVTGFIPYQVGTVNDAEPSAMLADYCTEPNHGANFLYLSPAIAGAGVLSYQSYCIAMGFFISPLEATQRAASDFIKEVLQITNSDAVWSAGVLNIFPYADVSVTGNGRTYTPNLAPIYAFTDDDFMPSTQGSSTAGADPVVVTRKPVSETYNVVRVEFLDRTNAYNTAIAEASDALDIALNGMRVMATLTFHSITTAPVARQVAQLILQRQLYIRNTFVFSVRPDYSLLEPMDLVAITDSTLGLVNKLVRLTEIDDDENDILTLTAEDMLVGTASAPLYNWQATQGYAANFGVLPPSVGTPVIFNAPPLLVSHVGGYELWVAVDQGAPGSWGGCDVYMSLDNVAYIYAGTMNGASRYGTLTAPIAAHADYDVSDTLAVQLTNPATTELQLLSGTAADYQNLRTLCFVGGEIMAYQSAALQSAGTYNLTTLRRGLYGSVASAHAAGSPFVRIDAGIFRVPFDVGMVGQTMYLKFVSFNVYQKSYQSLAACTAYSHVLTNVNAGQTMPGALTLIGNGVTTASSTAFKSAQTTAWDSSCYTTQSYTNGSSASAYITPSGAGSGSVMVGLTTNPSASNSYVNLAYAFANLAGTAYIYEAGTQIINLGAIAAGTLYNITYDGKHVAYYLGGALVRSVPIVGQTFFMQLCFYTPNDLVYGIDYGPTAAAVTPYTFVPMSLYVAGAGTRVSSTAAGGPAWGSRCWRSNESFTKGAFFSASINPAYGTQSIGLSTNPQAGDSTGLVNFTAGWQLSPTNGTVGGIFMGAQIAIAGAAPTTADIFTVNYDGFNYYWYRNNVLVAQRADPHPTTTTGLYLFGDFYTVSTGFVNVAFGPFATATPQQFVGEGLAVVSDTSVNKSGGAVAYDTAAVSIQGFPTCHIVWKANQTTANVFVGLTANAPPNTQINSLSVGWFCSPAGTLVLYQNGSAIASYGTYATSDFLAITYDGSTVFFWQNGVELASILLANATMFAGVLIADPGAGINSLEFGPGSVLPTITAGQIAINAVNASLIASGGITSAQIASGAITSTLLGNGTVLTTNIGTGQVWQSNIKGGAVTTTELGPGAVQTGNLGGGAVTTVNIAANNITTGLIAPLNVTTGTIAANAVSRIGTAVLASNTSSSPAIALAYTPDTTSPIKVDYILNNSLGSGNSAIFTLQRVQSGTTTNLVSTVCDAGNQSPAYVSTSGCYVDTIANTTARTYQVTMTGGAMQVGSALVVQEIKK